MRFSLHSLEPRLQYVQDVVLLIVMSRLLNLYHLLKLTTKEFGCLGIYLSIDSLL